MDGLAAYTLTLCVGGGELVTAEDPRANWRHVCLFLVRFTEIFADLRDRLALPRP